MKKLFTPLLAVLLFTACKKDHYDNDHLEDNDDHNKPKKEKIDVCHREGNGSSHIINISINAWPAHMAHGDVRLDDQDGDGYVPTNACGFGNMGDCNDLVATMNPGATEICGNNIDENCNGQLNESCIPSVTLCNKVWMTKNLDVSFYKNGDPIPQVTDIVAWTTLTTGAWCWYNNDSVNHAGFGKLYNWYAVNDPRGLAPLGWHIPTAAEWTSLTNCLGGSAVAGAAMKEAGTAHWINPNTGATNSSGFTGFGGGFRWGNVPDAYLLQVGYWWSATELSSTNASANLLRYDLSAVAASASPKTLGYSVRCVKN